jgi:hypothetical protein
MVATGMIAKLSGTIRSQVEREMESARAALEERTAGTQDLTLPLLVVHPGTDNDRELLCVLPIGTALRRAPLATEIMALVGGALCDVLHDLYAESVERYSAGLSFLHVHLGGPDGGLISLLPDAIQERAAGLRRVRIALCCKEVTDVPIPMVEAAMDTPGPEIEVPALPESLPYSILDLAAALGRQPLSIALACNLRDGLLPIPRGLADPSYLGFLGHLKVSPEAEAERAPARPAPSTAGRRQTVQWILSGMLRTGRFWPAGATLTSICHDLDDQVLGREALTVLERSGLLRRTALRGEHSRGLNPQRRKEIEALARTGKASDRGLRAWLEEEPSPVSRGNGLSRRRA